MSIKPAHVITLMILLLALGFAWAVRAAEPCIVMPRGKLCGLTSLDEIALRHGRHSGNFPHVSYVPNEPPMGDFSEADTQRFDAIPMGEEALITHGCPRAEVCQYKKVSETEVIEYRCLPLAMGCDGQRRLRFK